MQYNSPSSLSASHRPTALVSTTLQPRDGSSVLNMFVKALFSNPINSPAMTVQSPGGGVDLVDDHPTGMLVHP
jgi:hypothetical protein